MKANLFIGIALPALLLSCERVLEVQPQILASAEASVYEYERPVVHVTRTEALGSYIPCQLIIDGSPVTKLNAAGTTLLDMASQDIRLPRLTPGTHEVELVYGKVRKLYRDAESSCGERCSSSMLSLTVKESPKVAVALTFPRTDVDCYVLYPEEGMAVNANTGERKAISEMPLPPAVYTVGIYPFSSQKDGFSISGVGERLNVSKTATLIGEGIEISKTNSQSTDKSASRFTLSAAGRDILIQVAD